MQLGRRVLTPLPHTGFRVHGHRLALERGIVAVTDSLLRHSVLLSSLLKFARGCLTSGRVWHACSVSCKVTYRCQVPQAVILLFFSFAAEPQLHPSFPGWTFYAGYESNGGNMQASHGPEPDSFLKSCR